MKTVKQPEETREQTIQVLADMLRTTDFSVEFKAKKKPQGIKIIIEMTQDEINSMTDIMAKKQQKEE